MSDLKPKRGFVYPTTFSLFLNGGTIFAVDKNKPEPCMIPVLVVPDPDREPTEEEMRDLADKLYADAAPGALDGPHAAMFREIASAAFRLGARVPS